MEIKEYKKIVKNTIKKETFVSIFYLEYIF